MHNILLLLTIYFYWFLSLFLYALSSKTKKPKSVLYLAAFFPGNAGYHWRVKKWADLLREERYNVDIKTALSEADFHNLTAFNRSLFAIKFLHNRFWQVIDSRKYETVIVRRELLLQNDYGNLFLDKLLLKIHPNAILDIDDDIAAAKQEPRYISNFYAKLLMENGSKFTDSLKLYNWFFVGSEYLKNYVIKKNNEAKVEVIPTCVDYEKYEPKVYNLQKEEIVFGWIGGNHNLNLLDIIIAPLNKIAEKHKISLLVISGIEYNNERANFNIINKQWSLETEIEDIKLIDIGLMPLKNTKEDKGKAGFKLIQYMGLGVVSIASAVTVNRDIIDNEINGFLVYDDQWELVIEKCIQNHLKFEHYGHEARKKILKSYSFIANFDDYKNFLNI